MRWLSLVLAVFTGCASLFVEKERRGYLGVYYRSLTQELAEAYGLKDPKGVLVTEIIKDSPAEKAGIKEEDVILEWGSKEVSYLNFPELVSHTAIGEKVQVKLWRKSRVESVSVKVGAKVVDEQFLAQQEQERQEAEAFARALDLKTKEYNWELRDRWFVYVPKEGRLVEINEEQYFELIKKYGEGVKTIQARYGNTVYKAIVKPENMPQAMYLLEREIENLRIRMRRMK